jgi:hypothetical protein
MDIRLFMFWVRQAMRIRRGFIKDTALSVRAGFNADKDEWRKFVYELDNPYQKDKESAADITWAALASAKKG